MSKVPHDGRAKSEQSKQSYLAGKGKLVIASGVAASLLLASGVLWFVKNSASKDPETLTVSTVRPVETIRYAPALEKKAKSGPTETPNVQPPQGTIRRMEAISGTFSKK